MKRTYFNVKLEFDKQTLETTIQNAIDEAKVGYMCCIESNNLTIANINFDFLKIVNSALVNSCDGSNVAMILGFLHKKEFDSYVGSDLFAKYVCMKHYRHYFLGNTPEILSGLKKNLSLINSKISTMCFEALPFKSIDEFDYESIAKKINDDKPDIIWISLGAPKQEFFMSKLKPFLNRGVMIGIGAVFNFNAGVGKVRRAPKWMRKFRIEWLYRAFEEPKKNIPRYYNFLKILPGLIKEEKRKIIMS
ncbi:WecB/TagA/CpsF family glycosyltransferase [Candidatus Symbiothrix dinenymphae]|uniref:WecB/TagA/CpsF family glycosyltransferase n=1 Tax=Candidatus Symbiothrix dinenymphae TaxID=467085 RepID=UPI0006E35B97|nr:WecB/TagA/CpsF family glycosyltransferase [Candidatus Symbiothrix dinenymphae]